MQDASVIYLIIRRMKCLKCGKISHELPDIVVPYKRHEADCIEKALEEPLTSMQNSYCENSTIREWKHWFSQRSAYLENTIYAMSEKMNQTAFIRLPLYPLKNQNEGWLKILVRNIVNSGKWLQTCSA